jgi:hypothetical protein
LQTLRLDFCRGLKELPEDTRNLINLRHLGLSGCNSLIHMPYGLGKLIALQTLPLYILGKKKSRFSKPKGELGDLDGLDELRGLLWIKGLEHSRSSPSEAKTANLERKQLRHLLLEWDPKSSDESDKAIANDEQLLQNLRPHRNLKLLTITGYGGVRLSSWLSLLSNLSSIRITDCKWLQHIPPLDRFLFLKCLFLENLGELEYISNDGGDVSSSPLKILRLLHLPKLRGWRKTRETITIFPSFPSLSYLRIDNCPMMSLAPRSKTTPSSSSPLSHLSKLKYLYLRELEQLEYLPLEWLQNLTSLETLGIWDCCKMQLSMSPLFQHLSSLEKLCIFRCKELISSENEDGTHCLGQIWSCIYSRRSKFGVSPKRA